MHSAGKARLELLFRGSAVSSEPAGRTLSTAHPPGTASQSARKGEKGGEKGQVRDT